MGFKEWIVPQEQIFFDLLLKQAKVLKRAGKEFNAFATDWKDMDARFEKIKDMEHEADMAVHMIYNQCNTSFITPFDREDLCSLAYKMDEVLDYIYATCRRIKIYNVTAKPYRIDDLTKKLEEATDLIYLCLKLLHDKKNFDEIKANCITINSIENEMDTMLAEVLSELFKIDDVKTIIKHKEIYEHLERASDMAEDVANVVTDILLKNM